MKKKMARKKKTKMRKKKRSPLQASEASNPRAKYKAKSLSLSWLRMMTIIVKKKMKTCQRRRKNKKRFSNSMKRGLRMLTKEHW
jgi:prophage tail gpP-like protein